MGVKISEQEALVKRISNAANGKTEKVTERFTLDW